MTEPSVFADDVNKLKDADEIKQAYIGLKDTNRYAPPAISPPLLQVFSDLPSTPCLHQLFFVPFNAVKLQIHCTFNVCVRIVCTLLCPVRSPRFMRQPLEVGDLLSRLR